MNTSLLLHAVIVGVTSGFVYGLIGLGMSAIFRGTGIINAMQGEFAVVSAIVAAALLSAGAPVVAAVLAALAVAALAALVVERLLVRPLVRRHASEASYLLLTLGLSLLSSAALLYWAGRDPRQLPGIGGSRSFEVLGATLRWHALAVIVIGAVLTILIKAFFSRTVFGLSMVASASDPDGARTTGIDVARTRAATFVLGGLLGAVAGLLIAPLTPLHYLSGLALTLKGFAAAVLGGLAHPTGDVVGGIIFGLIESLAVLLFPSELRDIVAFGLLLVVLILLPRGILVTGRVRHGG